MNTETVVTANKGKKLMYAIYSTIGVLIIILVISLSTNVSRAGKLAVMQRDYTNLQGSYTGLQTTLKVHDSTNQAIETGQAQVIAKDSAQIAGNKAAAIAIAGSIADINKQLARIGN